MVDALAFVASFLAVVCAGAATLLSFGRAARSRGLARRALQGLALFAGCMVLANLAAPFVIDDPYPRSVVVYTGMATLLVWFGMRSLAVLTYETPRRSAET